MSAGRFCLVFHSTTKGKPSRLVDRFSRKMSAIEERKRLQKGQGFGGWYAVHTCDRLGPDFRKEIGLEGVRKRRRR